MRLTLALFLLLPPLTAHAVVDGEETTDYPAIRMMTDERGRMKCTLNFLSDTTAVTAAHCLGDLSYGECRVERDEMNRHYNGQTRTFTCASHDRCETGVKDKDGKVIKAISCFAPKAYYVGTELLEYLPLANLLVTGRSLPERSLFYGFTPHDLAIVVFEKGTGEKLGLKKEDYLKVSRWQGQVWADVQLVGYGNNTGKDKSDTGAGTKRKGLNAVMETAWRTLRVNGPTKNKRNDGKKVSSGKGDSGGALISLRAIDKGDIIGITSGGYKDRGFPDADAGASYFGYVNSDFAHRLFVDSVNCDWKKNDNIKNSALGYCADDVYPKAK